jgi:uncharacterized membrane protein
MIIIIPLVIALTWYYTRKYYTRTLTEEDLRTVNCYHCGKHIHIHKENTRVYNYCVQCA